jgi:hypothetical protein
MPRLTDPSLFPHFDGHLDLFKLALCLTVLLAAAATCFGGFGQAPAPGSAPGSAPGNAPGNGGAPANANAGDLRLTMLAVRDPMVNNQVAFRMLIPQGWQSQGGIVWMHDKSNLATAMMRVANPRGAERLDVFPQVPYVWSQQGIFGFGPGSNYLGNIVAQPMEPAGYVTQVLLPHFRQGVQARVVGREPLPKVAELTARQAQEPGAQKTARAERIRVEYQENGVLMHEDFYCVIVYSTSPIAPGMMNWQPTQLYSFRAQAGRLDANAPLLHAMVSSVSIDLKWFAQYQQVVQMWFNNQMAAIRQAGELSRYIAQVNDQITEMNRRAWENQQRSQDAISRNFSEYIRGTETYHSTYEQGPVELPGGYNDVWVSGNGEYVLSNEAGFNPNVGDTQNWTRIEPVRP